MRAEAVGSTGHTLSDYLLAELARLAARPTRDEMLGRLHGRKRVTLTTPAAVVIREEREPRDRCRRISLLEFLLQTPLGTRVEARHFRDDDEFHAPYLVDVDVTQGLR